MTSDTGRLTAEHPATRGAHVAMFPDHNRFTRPGPRVVYDGADPATPPAAPPAATGAPTPPPGVTGAPGPTPAPSPPPTGTTAPVAFSSPWKEGELYKVGDKEWWDGIAEQPVKDLMAAKQYKTPYELAIAYHNANKMLNANGETIVLPGENATPEQIEAFQTKLGRPATPNDYQLQFGDTIKTDPNMIDFGKGLFHKLGLNAKQAQQAADMWNEHLGKEGVRISTDWKTQNDAAIAALHSKWGDKAAVDLHLAAGRRGLAALGMSDAALASVEAHTGAAPVVEMLVSIGKRLTEGGFKGGDGTGGNDNPVANMTQPEARAEISKLGADPDFQKQYHSPDIAIRKPAMDRLAALHAKA